MEWINRMSIASRAHIKTTKTRCETSISLPVKNSNLLLSPCLLLKSTGFFTTACIVSISYFHWVSPPKYRPGRWPCETLVKIHWVLRSRYTMINVWRMGLSVGFGGVSNGFSGFPVFRFYHQNTPQHETLLWIYLVDIVGVLPDKIKKKTHNKRLSNLLNNVYCPLVSFQQTSWTNLPNKNSSKALTGWLYIAYLDCWIEALLPAVGAHLLSFHGTSMEDCHVARRLYLGCFWMLVDATSKNSFPKEVVIHQ